jgi:hypothetical protein
VPTYVLGTFYIRFFLYQCYDIPVSGEAHCTCWDNSGIHENPSQVSAPLLVTTFKKLSLSDEIIFLISILPIPM